MGRWLQERDRRGAALRGAALGGPAGACSLPQLHGAALHHRQRRGFLHPLLVALASAAQTSHEATRQQQAGEASCNKAEDCLSRKSGWAATLFNVNLQVDVDGCAGLVAAVEQENKAQLSLGADGSRVKAALACSGWVGGWVVGWVGGWVDGRASGRAGGWVGGWVGVPAGWLVSMLEWQACTGRCLQNAPQTT